MHQAAPCEEGVGMTSHLCSLSTDKRLSQFSRVDVAPGCPEAPGPRRTGLAVEPICRLVSSMVWTAEANTRWVRAGGGTGCSGAVEGSKYGIGYNSFEFYRMNSLRKKEKWFIQ